MRSVAIACIVAISTASAVHAKWERVTTAPQDTRAIVVSSTWSLVGFTASSTRQSTFARSASGTITASPLTAIPEFYAYARDVNASRLCLALSQNARRSFVCYGIDGRQLERMDLPIPMTSGALANGNSLWVVDPSGRTAPRRMALVELSRAGNRWIEKRRARSPLCQPSDTDHDCSELEIHPASRDSLSIIPVLGRFDGTVFRYPMVAIWNTARGTIKRVKLPSASVPESLRAQYRVIGERPLRLIYRSAASASGKFAIVPVLPSDEKQGVKRDQLWLYDGGNTWHRIPAPAPINAVTFVGNQPVIVTGSGDILKWVP
jgi:hypothetical protein